MPVSKKTKKKEMKKKVVKKREKSKATKTTEPVLKTTRKRKLKETLELNALMLPTPEPIEIFKADSLVQKLENFDDMIVFKCPGTYRRKPCGHTHFRHAGYMQFLIPWMKSDKKRKISKESTQVMVCVKCRSAYVYLNDTFYDVTDKIDLQAWEKTEKEMQKATGPGGEC